jgi:hypothetical protein
MGDAGEGLIDAESRIQERMEELERARTEKSAPAVKNPELLQAVESLRLARAELQNQFDRTTHEQRRAHLAEALAEVDRQLVGAEARLAVE